MTSLIIGEEQRTDHAVLSHLVWLAYRIGNQRDWQERQEFHSKETIQKEQDTFHTSIWYSRQEYEMLG